IESLVVKADVCMVVGTASTVSSIIPAAGITNLLGNVAVFNPHRSEGDESADFLFLGLEDLLPKALMMVDMVQIEYA
ncbi:hypothetical protein DFJ43DRAFT_1001118, partial [Lentinula guzmanii]